MIEVIKRWYQGENVLYDAVGAIGIYKKQHITAKIAASIIKFCFKKWDFLLASALSLYLYFHPIC